MSGALSRSTSSDEQCNRAQVVAISAALDYIMQVGGKEEL